MDIYVYFYVYVFDLKYLEIIFIDDFVNLQIFFYYYGIINE